MLFCTLTASKRVFMNNNTPLIVASDMISKAASSSWPWLSWVCVSETICQCVCVCFKVSMWEKSVWCSSAGQRGTAWRYVWVMRWMSSRLSRLPSSSVITYAVVGSSFVHLSVCLCVCVRAHKTSVWCSVLWRATFSSACSSGACGWFQDWN